MKSFSAESILEDDPTSRFKLPLGRQGSDAPTEGFIAATRLDKDKLHFEAVKYENTGRM